MRLFKALLIGAAIFALLATSPFLSEPEPEGVVRPCIQGEGVSLTYYGVAVAELGDGLCRYYAP